MLVKDFLYNYVIPPGIVKLSHKLTKKRNESQNTLSSVQDLFSKNEKFKNIHQGERCFILATGPSINTQDLTVLKDEICISVAQFFHHKDIDIIKPKYHVLAPCHDPFDFNTLKKVIPPMNRVYDDSLTACFMGYTEYQYSNYNFLEKYPEEKRENFYHLNYSKSINLTNQSCKLQDIWDICKSPFTVRTVIYSAITIANYMGFKEIYLLGCDADYLLDLKRTSNHHFYDENKSFSDKEHLERASTEDFFLAYYNLWREYKLMRDYLNDRKIKIFNATNGGMLDVFERVNLNDVVTN